MTIPNQNNYPNVLLGWGTGTIKDYGCTLASLSAISGIEILKLNTMLKGSSFKDSAFAGATKNLINWTQLEKYTNGKIKHIWRGYDYDQQKIYEAIKKHGFCLVEVLNSGTKHWIVATGNKKALDPLTGGEISTSKYPTWTGWSELEVKEVMANELEVCMADRKKFWEERDQAREEVERLKIDKRHLEEKVRELDFEKNRLTEEVNKLSVELKECQSNPQKTKIEKEVNIAGIPMVINGGTVNSDGVVTANYRIK